MHKILGQVDILGVPIGLGSTLLAGLSGLLVAPVRARSPEEFARSLGRGALALLQAAGYGVFNAFGQVRWLHAA
jgi:hypothetical protein